MMAPRSCGRATWARKEPELIDYFKDDTCGWSSLMKNRCGYRLLLLFMSKLRYSRDQNADIARSGAILMISHGNEALANVDHAVLALIYPGWGGVQGLN